MNYCSACGSEVIVKVPGGDHLPRHVCPSCGAVHYQNPKIVVGCVPQEGDRILLCKRAIEPRYGYWTLPAGFMENGETLVEGAARETREEALAEVDIEDLFAVVNVVHAQQVHMLFRARLVGGFGAGDESLEVQLFSEDRVPWDDIAFGSVRYALEKFFEDRREGVQRMHMTALKPMPR